MLKNVVVVDLPDFSIVIERLVILCPDSDIDLL